MTYTLIWTGKMDHDESCPCLSTYLGNSPLTRVIERQDMTGPDEPTLRGRMRGRGPDRSTRTPFFGHDKAIAGMLKKGVSYGAISRKLGVSFSPVRRVAKRMKEHAR